MLGFGRKHRLAVDSSQPMTLTEASRKSGLVVTSRGLNSAYSSSSRRVPYVEVYSERTGIMETPAAVLQRAADDEAKREDSKG
jgi:hypothetical protein